MVLINIGRSVAQELALLIVSHVIIRVPQHEFQTWLMFGRQQSEAILENFEYWHIF